MASEFLPTFTLVVFWRCKTIWSWWSDPHGAHRKGRSCLSQQKGRPWETLEENLEHGFLFLHQDDDDDENNNENGNKFERLSLGHENYVTNACPDLTDSSVAHVVGTIRLDSSTPKLTPILYQIGVETLEVNWSQTMDISHPLSNGNGAAWALHCKIFLEESSLNGQKFLYVTGDAKDGTIVDNHHPEASNFANQGSGADTDADIDDTSGSSSSQWRQYLHFST